MRLLSRPVVLSLLIGLTAAAFIARRTASFLVLRPDQARLTPRCAVTLDEPDASSATGSVRVPARPALRVLITPVLEGRLTTARYRPLVEYLARRVGREPALLEHRTSSEVVDLVRNRRCELALVSLGSFLQGERQFGMEMLAVPQVAGEVTFQSLVLVPASSSASSLLELKARRFACADTASVTGWIHPAHWLRQQGLDIEKYFSEYSLVVGHDEAITSVASRFVDGAAASSLVYERLVATDESLSQRVRVISRSAPLPIPPMVTHPRLDPALKLQLSTLLLGMQRDPDGRWALASMGVDRFVAPVPSRYETARALVAGSSR
ncbi:MAG: PhnD/SsuA/transferrin family substrate-binding protein [Candidatus Riflebacteria bacterium]|nr:PhnD/SsuA/transferrin family substrate-binding protein [Candidatus Riflebacteria bacterium]